MSAVCIEKVRGQPSLVIVEKVVALQLRFMASRSFLRSSFLKPSAPLAIKAPHMLPIFLGLYFSQPIVAFD